MVADGQVTVWLRPKPYNHILEISGQDCAKHDTGTTSGRPGGYGGEKMNWDGIKGFLTTAGVDLLRGLIALAVGLFLVHWVMKLFERYEPKMKIEPTLRGFIKNLIGSKCAGLLAESGEPVLFPADHENIRGREYFF